MSYSVIKNYIELHPKTVDYKYSEELNESKTTDYKYSAELNESFNKKSVKMIQDNSKKIKSARFVIEMRFRIIMCFLLFISFTRAVQGQFIFCSDDAQCRAFGNPSCDPWSGFCSTPLSDTDCDYLGAGTGKTIEIDGFSFCTKTCSAHSDCSHLPTAKVCQTDSLLPNYNTCVECKNPADCTAIGFKNHICPKGFCKHPNPAGTDCFLTGSNYCHSPTGADCFDNTIKCWAICGSDSEC